MIYAGMIKKMFVLLVNECFRMCRNICKPKLYVKQIAIFILLVMGYIYMFEVIIESTDIIEFNNLKTTDLRKPAYSGPGFGPVGDQHESFVYSAYYDNRSTVSIIQITVLLKNIPTIQHFTCILWDLNNQPIKLKGLLQYIPDYRRPLYYSGFVKCSLEGIKQRFTEISLIPTVTEYRISETKYPQNILYIKYPVYHFKRNVTRCVPPLFNYTNKINIIQMIENDRLMGTDYFEMYNYKNNSVIDILEYYKRKGIMEIHPWNLPIRSNTDKDVHYHAQYLHMHDCLMRNLHVSRYVFFADIDELIVSRKYDTWKEIIDDHKECGSISFQNAFFKPGVTNVSFPLKELALKYNLNTFWTNYSKFYVHGDRSKVLLKTEEIWICKIHAVKYFLSSLSKKCFMDSKDAFLHHNRPADPWLHENSAQHENLDILRRSEQLIKKIVSVIHDSNVVKNLTTS